MVSSKYALCYGNWFDRIVAFSLKSNSCWREATCPCITGATGLPIDASRWCCRRVIAHRPLPAVLFRCLRSSTHHPRLGSTNWLKSSRTTAVNTASQEEEEAQQKRAQQEARLTFKYDTQKHAHAQGGITHRHHTHDLTSFENNRV